MKIGVIGDIHFGSHYAGGKTDPKLQINTRLIDYADTLEYTIDKIVEFEAEEIIMTGDIFEHRYPSIVQQKMFSRALHYAFSKGIQKIHIVIGNHDQQRTNTTTTLSYLKELNLPNIRIYDELSLETFNHSGKQVANLIFMPYRDRMWLGAETYSQAISILREQLNDCLDQITNDLPKILVGHMTIEGTLFDDEYRDLYSENQLMLPIDMFNELDLTIMGHIHKPGVVCEDPYVAYVGSMEKRGGFEDHDKVFAIIDLETAEVAYHREPCREIFDFNIDYTTVIHGDQLQKRIYADLELFSKTHKLEGSILRTSIRICAEDNPYIDIRELAKHIKGTYRVNYYTEIKKDIFSARQSRDDRITEDVEDGEALRLFLENTIDDQEFRKQCLDAGIDLIRSLEGVDATHQN